MTGTERSFQALGDDKLAKAGLAGPLIRARLDGGTLILTGTDRRQLVLPAAGVDRIRHLRMRKLQEFTQGYVRETRIWWGGRPEPILLMPYLDVAEFHEGIGQFAAAVEAAHGSGRRLSLGADLATAIGNLLIVGIPVLLLLAYVWWVAVQDGGWWWAGAAGITLLFGWLGGRVIRPQRLRTVSLDRFKAELR